MANNIVFYKDVAIGTETTYGSSVAASDYIHVKSYGVQDNYNKERLDDTSNTPKGHLRIDSRRVDVTGAIEAYGSPRVLHHLLEMVQGTAAAVGTSVGTSATRYDYLQTSGNSFISKSIYVELNNYREAHHGIRASQIELNAENDLLNASADLLGVKVDYGTGVSISPTSEAAKPFKFSNLNVIRAATLAGISAGVTLSVNNWTVTYNNGLEGTHQSGNKFIKRSDIKIPTIELSFTVYGETNDWQLAKQGCSTYAFRISGVMDPCQGTINGATPYELIIDIPAAEVITADITRTAGEYVSEDVVINGKYDSVNDALWIARLTRENA